MEPETYNLKVTRVDAITINNVLNSALKDEWNKDKINYHSMSHLCNLIARVQALDPDVWG